MPAVNTTLSNCYIPLPASTSCIKEDHSSLKQVSVGSSKKNILCCPLHRPAGSHFSKTRTARSIRHLCVDRGILSNSTGSSIVELGHTKVICNVQGPRPLSASSVSGSNVLNDGSAISTGRLHCQIRYASDFTSNMQYNTLKQATQLDKLSSVTSANVNVNAQETDLSLKLHDALAPSLPMHLFMKNVVDVFVLVIQDDGAVFPACLMAASLALADAGVEVYDLVSSFSIAVVSRENISFSRADHDENDEVTGLEEDMEDLLGTSKFDERYHLLADPDEEETMIADGTLTVGIMNNWREVVFWDQTGRLPPDVVSEAVELCKEGCVFMHNYLRQALVGKQTMKK